MNTDLSYSFITIEDSRYPSHLRLIENPPRKLYYIGNIDLIQAPCIAVVGTRRASPYGRWAAYEISKRISACHVPVVSGMASGIDTQAHRGCIENNGYTVAVLGTGIDVAYPKSNERLYGQICEKGLVLSEFEPGDCGAAWHFPLRNRIISGLADKVIVVEGAYVSGSMITAKLALDQGRDVYAVPGNINQPGSIGVNSLIADGAYPIISLDDLASVLGIENAQLEMTEIKADPRELMLLNLVKQNPGISSGEISERLNKPANVILSCLSAMELKGMLRSEGCRYWSR